MGWGGGEGGVWQPCIMYTYILYTFIPLYFCTFILIYITYIHIYIYTYIHIYIYTYIHIYIYTYIHIYIYTYIHIYMYTYTHIYTICWTVVFSLSLSPLDNLPHGTVAITLLFFDRLLSAHTECIGHGSGAGIRKTEALHEGTES